MHCADGQPCETSSDRLAGRHGLRGCAQATSGHSRAGSGVGGNQCLIQMTECARGTTSRKPIAQEGTRWYTHPHEEAGDHCRLHPRAGHFRPGGDDPSPQQPARACCAALLQRYVHWRGGEGDDDADVIGDEAPRALPRGSARGQLGRPCRGPKGPGNRGINERKGAWSGPGWLARGAIARALETAQEIGKPWPTRTA